MRKEMVGLAAEFAVASELCRRDIYAQLTSGHQKRTDLLIFSEDNQLLRIEVKGKQGGSWPNCKGIYGSNVVLVFVDFAGKGEREPPDFYILTVREWVAFVEGEIRRLAPTRIVLDDRNVPIFLDQVDKKGEPYKGMGVSPDQIREHHEKWEKIEQAVKRGAGRPE